jgi:TRAP-type C4-dicarboxylate transport system substrate-binding protein
MVHKIIIFIVLSVSLICFQAITSQHVYAQKPIELKVSNYHPSSFVTQRDILVPLMKILEERTGGKVKAIHYAGGSLIGAKDMYDGVVSGLTDIGHGYAGHTPGKFELAGIMELPGLGVKTALHGSRVFWQLYQEFPEIRSEFKDVHILFLAVHEPFVFHTKKPIRALKDLKGMKLRTTHDTAKYYSKLDAIPVTMPGSEGYLALEKGIVDGSTGDWTQLIGFKETEVTKYTTVFHLNAGVFYAVMNKKKHDSLPPDVKKVVDELSGKWGNEFAGKAWSKEEKACEDKAKLIPGRELIYLSEDEENKFRERFKPFYEEWISNMEKKGKPGRKIFNAALRYIKEIPAE